MFDGKSKVCLVSSRANLGQKELFGGEQVLRLTTEEYQAAVFKALGNVTRLTIINILANEGEKCVCEIVDRLDFDQSTISKHLSVLRAAGIVTSRKEGLNVIYRLSMPCVYRFLKCVQHVMDGSQSCSSEGTLCTACPSGAKGITQESSG